MAYFLIIDKEYTAVIKQKNKNRFFIYSPASYGNKSRATRRVHLQISQNESNPFYQMRVVLGVGTFTTSGGSFCVARRLQRLL